MQVLEHFIMAEKLNGKAWKVNFERKFNFTY